MLALLASATIFARGARAGHTVINPCIYDSESEQAGILSHVYGGSFVANGLNYSNGALTATRLSDFGAIDADQCWKGELLSVRALARFGGFEQSLGLFDGESGGVLQNLFHVSGSGFNVNGSAANLNLGGKAFRFARAGEGDMFTSLDTDNLVGSDQMVTYHLTGNGLNKYVLFFEDASAAQNSDRDFNDLVVEIDGASPHAIPLPPAFWSGLAMLVTGGLWNARSRMRAWFK